VCDLIINEVRSWLPRVHFLRSFVRLSTLISRTVLNMPECVRFLGAARPSSAVISEPGKLFSFHLHSRFYLRSVMVSILIFAAGRFARRDFCVY